MVYYQPAQLDATFAALADPTRREVLHQLALGERTIGELAAGFTMTLPALSKHVRVLQRAGLTQVRKDGRVRRCTIRPAPLRDAAEWISRYGRFWEEQFDRLAAYLATHSGEESAEWTRQLPPPTKRTRSVSNAPSTRRASGSSTRGPARKK